MNKEPNAFEALFYWLLMNYQTVFAAIVYILSMTFLLVLLTKNVKI